MNLDRLRAAYLEGPADLVIEIASPSTRGVDHGDKFYEYEQGGVPEYWLLDPERRRPEFFLLDAEGIYSPVVVGPVGVYESPALSGLRLRVEWLWTRPSVFEIASELGLGGG
ncbi:MAG: Uma2 family endonuclease [Armatimonadetes bacterium]|nr:Uma2 family endonuclease [Armatimonadota bacterium]